MKTKLIIISISAFLLSALFLTAQQNNVSKSVSSNGSYYKGPYYTDKNKDGICDNRQSSKNAQTYKGQNYVDKNKDGVCDNRQNKKTGYCCGKGYCNQYRHGWRNGNQNGWKK
jgi:hypothetical protein